MRILVTDGMDKGSIETLKNRGHEVVEKFYDDNTLGEALKDFDVCIVRSATKVRQKHLDIAKEGKLKLVIRGGVGVDNIDVKYAESVGITVKNTPKASSRSVAELALGHMFACSRYINAAGETMRQGRWEKKAYGSGCELFGKTLGIIGYGRIGQALGNMAQALGMTVLAYDVYKDESLVSDTMKYVELDELLNKSDYISLHTPSLDGKPLINKETISKMKDGVIFINTSRGNNVDEAALIEALNTGKIKAAGLDVFQDEKAPNWSLIHLPNVSATPHIGAQTKEAQVRIGTEIVEIIDNFNK